MSYAVSRAFISDVIVIQGRSEYVAECGKQRHPLTCPQAVTVNIIPG